MSITLRYGLTSAVLSVVREKGHVSGPDMESIARDLRIPTSRVYGFCSQFPEFTRPPGRPLLQVCSGPACAATGWEAKVESAMGELRLRSEILRVPGLMRLHRPPALAVCLPGEEERMVEGFRQEELEELAMSLDRKDLSSYPLPDAEEIPQAGEASEGAVSPWLASLLRKGLISSPDEEMVREVSGNPAPIREFLEGECGFSSLIAQAGPPEVLVCDVVGPCPEGSADLLVSRTSPGMVAMGAAMAALALGARKVVFYLPWNLLELESVFGRVAEEAASLAGLEWEVFPGPTYIPCWRDIGVAAVLRGTMLWRAASICGRDGPLHLELPTLVCGAFTLWKLPWMVREEGGLEESTGRHTLIAVGPDGASRWMELPPSLPAAELGKRLSEVLGDRSPKAFYLEGQENRVYAGDSERVDIPRGARRLLVLDDSRCMAGWARRMLEMAVEGCCGGCTPGRTAPAAAAALISSGLKGGDGEHGLRKIKDLLERAEQLALCPQLGRTFPVIRKCMDFFPEDFALLSGGEDKPEPTVSGSSKTSGIGGRK